MRAVARETLAKLKTDKLRKHAPGPTPGPISRHVTGAICSLLLSGCRLSEILSLRWDNVDVARGLLVLPDSKTGPRPVWLSAAALAVLETLAEIRTGDYVIAGERPDRPRSDLKRPWGQIVKHAGLVDVSLHTRFDTQMRVWGSALELGCRWSAPCWVIALVARHNDTRTSPTIRRGARLRRSAQLSRQRWNGGAHEEGKRAPGRANQAAEIRVVVGCDAKMASREREE